MLPLDFSQLPRFKPFQYQIVTLIPEWASAYEVPREAIERQIIISHAWINSNPKKAPKKNVTRFLWNWLGQARKWGNLRLPDKTAIKTNDDVENYDMTFEEMQEIRRRNFGLIKK